MNKFSYIAHYANIYYALVKSAGLTSINGVLWKIYRNRTLGNNLENTEKTFKYSGYKYPITIRANKGDISTLIQVFVEREYQDYSSSHVKMLEKYYNHVVSIKKTPLIIDCGANIGLASIWYTSMFPNAKIISIEPDPNNFRVLTRNTAQYINIIPLHAAISNNKSKVSISNPEVRSDAFIVKEDEFGNINSTTINDLLIEHPDVVPFIAKIDIEGFESEMFKSNTEWVSKFPLIVFEKHDWMLPWRGCAHQIYKALTSIGPREYSGHGENVFSYSHELNDKSSFN